LNSIVFHIYSNVKNQFRYFTVFHDFMPVFTQQQPQEFKAGAYSAESSH